MAWWDQDVLAELTMMLIVDTCDLIDQQSVADVEINIGFTEIQSIEYIYLSTLAPADMTWVIEFP